MQVIQLPAALPAAAVALPVPTDGQVLVQLQHQQHMPAVAIVAAQEELHLQTQLIQQHLQQSTCASVSDAELLLQLQQPHHHP